MSWLAGLDQSKRPLLIAAERRLRLVTSCGVLKRMVDGEDEYSPVQVFGQHEPLSRDELRVTVGMQDLRMSFEE